MGAAQPSPRSPSAGTAKTLILVGLILQALEVLIVLGIGFVFLIVFVGIFFLFAGFLGIIWLLIVYLFAYRRVAEGRYEAARAPTIIVAILSLLTLDILSGILYLIAYVKLGDAIRETQESAARQSALAAAPPPAAMRVCLGCGTVLPSPPPKFCSTCGKAVPT